MKTKSILLILFLLTTQAVVAQIMFQRHYGGLADDFGCRVLQIVKFHKVVYDNLC